MTAEEAREWYWSDDAKENRKMVDFYSSDNGKELRKISDQILRGELSSSWREQNLSKKDEHEFYSIANDVLWDVTKRWNKVNEFRGLLYEALKNRFYSEFRRKRTQKRGKDKEMLSLEAKVTEDGSELGELIDSNMSIEEELQKSGLNNVFASKGVIQYIDGLSSKQKQLLYLQIDGFSTAEIKEKMKLSGKDFQNLNDSLKDYERISLLFPYINNSSRRKDTEDMRKKDEDSKSGVKPIDSICYQLDEGFWNCNHPMQRPSGQWSNVNRSKFICDILHGYSMLPVVISEEVKKDSECTTLWLIDGVQRCTIMDSFLHDGFKISSAVEKPMVKYTVTEVDENGRKKRNKNGSPVVRTEEFDIRNKKFSQLPKELQDDFMSYEYPTIMNLNCTSEKIIYDIARMNRSRPMTGAQINWTGLSEEMAIMIKQLIQRMEFFRPENDTTNFKISDMKNGQIEKMVVEALMLIFFENDYSTNFKRNCEFLARHADIEETTGKIYRIVSTLCEVLTPDVADLFTATKSMLWIALFDKFQKIDKDGEEIEGSCFVDFLREFKETLSAKEINGESIDTIGSADCHRRGKMQRKMSILYRLMYDYFGVEYEEPNEPEENQSDATESEERETQESCINLGNDRTEEPVAEQQEIEEFVTDLHNEPDEETQKTEEENTVTETVTGEQKNNSENGEEQSEVVESFEESPKEPIDIKKFCSDILHKEILDEDIELFKNVLHADTKDVDPDVPLLEDDNMPSLIAMVAWSYQEEKDRTLDKWLPAYIKKTNEYKKNQAENFKDMRVAFMVFEATNMREEAS